MSDPRGEVKVFDGVAFVARGDVVLGLWKEPARLHRSKWLFDQVEPVIARYPDGIVTVLFILPSSSPPDGPSRAENQRRLATMNKSLRCFILVPLGDAMWTAIVRTVMRGVAIVTGMKTHAIARNESEAFDRLLKVATVHTPPRRELQAAMVELYRALGVTREEDATRTT